MKRKQILIAFCAAVLLSPIVTSCGNAEIDDPIYLPEVEKTDKEVIEKPIITVSPVETEAYVRTVEIEDPYIKEVIFLDDMTALAYTSDAKAKSRAGGKGILKGIFTVEDGKIIAHIGDYTITVPVSGEGDVTINDKVVETVVKKKETTDATMSLCRTWFPKHYQVVVYSATKAFCNYEATTLEELQKKASDGVGSDVKLVEHEIKKVTFMPDKTLATFYDNDDIEVDLWEWTNIGNGELIVNFDEEKPDYRNLSSTVRYEDGSSVTAYLVVNFKVQMKGRDGKYFTADAMTTITMTDRP